MSLLDCLLLITRKAIALVARSTPGMLLGPLDSNVAPAYSRGSPWGRLRLRWPVRLLLTRFGVAQGHQSR